jgi:23S rRNA (uridine2552-2'-O)-methyltransferase
VIDRRKKKLKPSRNRTVSSRQWLTRQLNDPYVQRAKSEGYRSRAAYKLIEIDDKAQFLKRGGRVVDLGAAPGGWSQVAAARVGSESGKGKGAKGKVVAIDLLDVEAIPGVEFMQLDFNDADAPEKLKEMLGGPADVVLSDMAGNTTGHRQTDHLKIVALVEMAAEFAREAHQAAGEPRRFRRALCAGAGFSRLEFS